MTDRAELPARLRSNALVTIIDKDAIAAVPPTNAPLLIEAAARIEALEAALREIAKQRLYAEVAKDGADAVDESDFIGAYDACVERARAALTPESPQ